MLPTRVYIAAQLSSLVFSFLFLGTCLRLSGQETPQPSPHRWAAPWRPPAGSPPLRRSWVLCLRKRERYNKKIQRKQVRASTNHLQSYRHRERLQLLDHQAQRARWPQPLVAMLAPAWDPNTVPWAIANFPLSVMMLLYLSDVESKAKSMSKLDVQSE